MNKDRKRGALIGLAVGDALGAAVEFRDPGTFAPVTCYRNGGPHSLAAGQWTDDTSMALALADSLGRGWNLNDQAAQYVQWLENGKYSVNGWCFDIGSTTRQAIERFMESGDATKSGLTYPGDSGNGGIMRIAPVAIYAAGHEYHTNWNCTTIYNLGVDSSAVTHASEMCKSAAGWMALMLVDLISGTSREEALRYRPELENALHPAIKAVAKGSYKENVVRGSGFVVQSLEAALWAFHDANSFEEAVLKAVNLGDDADTTGAICGQFAGAYWGESGIPESLRNGLDKKEMLEAALTSLGV
jgi:ADP-ribosyl-[dinitrogen reductase] hydrolase